MIHTNFFETAFPKKGKILEARTDLSHKLKIKASDPLNKLEPRRSLHVITDKSFRSNFYIVMVDKDPNHISN